MDRKPTRFNVNRPPAAPHRFVRIVVTMEEIDYCGKPAPLVADALSIVLKKDLELFVDDEVLFARMKQDLAAKGEERIGEDERFLGLSADQSAKEAVWEYVAYRLGIKT